jgi:hypothetical protein
MIIIAVICTQRVVIQVIMDCIVVLLKRNVEPGKI